MDTVQRCSLGSGGFFAFTVGCWTAGADEDCSLLDKLPDDDEPADESPARGIGEVADPEDAAQDAAARDATTAPNERTNEVYPRNLGK